MIKYNNNTINDWNFGTSNLIKVYRNNAIVFYKVSGDSPTPEYKVCFAVVDDISQYQETEFEDVFDNATEKWYKLNNLNQYEEYGVYGSGKNITYYDGKLTIDDGYEYEWNGSSWVNVGEVTGSTATLPNVPFTLNYNAKNYDASTHTIPYTEGALNAIDAVITGETANIIDHHENGYIQLTGSTSTTIRALVGTTNFSRSSSNPNITIVCKAYTPGSSSEGNILSNRNQSYNWMYRHKSTQLRFHGTSEQGSIAVSNTEPNTCSVRIDSSRLLKYNNWTQNTTSSYSNFNYGSNSNGGALFSGYYSSNGEYWKGVFYWIYMTLNTLTDEQVQQVIDYNEGGGQFEYPKYYSEKSDPLDDLTFNTLDEAQAYAYNNCVYDGMKATIGTDRYYFDSEDENGWVKILEYYKVEDVTSGGASGWTISGSSTYNPDSSYYDDFDLQTSSRSNVTKIAKVTIYGYDHFTYYLRTSGYSNSCYVMATNVDEVSTPPSTMSYNSSSAITHTYNWNKSPKSAVNLSNYRRVTYNNLDKTVEHTFYVYFYGRTYSSYIGNATILIPKEQTNENWEQVTFSSSQNVSGTSKNLYIDNNNSTNGGTSYWYYRWIIGLPSGSHSSYTNFSSYDYCPNVTSSTFTSVAGNSRQVNFIYDSATNKSLTCRLVDTSGNTLTPTNTVYYQFNRWNSCNVQSNMTIPFTTSIYSVWFKTGGRFSLNNTTSYPNMYHIYGYTPPALGTTYYVDNYSSTFDITYTKLSEEAVTITYTTYDPNDSETPAFKTDITYPYNGGTTSSTTLTSFDVPYTYPYTVKQTNDMFSADSQSFTAGQAARTISFTLYPNNREFATVADLEAYGYAWEGMTAYVGSDKYVYQNGEWVYNPSRLPSGYQEVEYIQNTASGSNSSSTSRLAIKFEDSITNNESAYTYEITCLIGTNNSAYWDFCGNPYVQIQKTDSGYGNKFEPRAWGKNFSGAPAGQFYNNIKYKLRIYQGTSYPMLEVTNITAETTNAYSMTSTRSGMKNNSVKFGLFNFYNESDGGAHLAPGKIYSLKIYDQNNTLIADAVPCVRTSDNKCGFYNLARNEFEYDASGNLTLTAGPNVN